MKQLMVLLILCVLTVGGCGNVSLRGDAMTAAETSALHAHQASKRLRADENAPAWSKDYADENYKQWRFFVRSAKADETWGPQLDGE